MRISWRVALLSATLILMIELLVLLPAVGYYRSLQLQELVDDTALVIDSLLSSPSDTIDDEQSKFLLSKVNVYNITLLYEDRQELLLTPQTDKPVNAGTYDLVNDSLLKMFFIGPSCIFSGRDDVIRVIGQPALDEYGVDMTAPEIPICQETRRFARDLFIISLWLSLFAAALLYLATNFNLAAPILRLTRAITGFDASQRDRTQLVEPSSSVREIRQAEVSLRDMQERVIIAMEQRDKLASLGESVSKIQHDLRNMLSTASLNADRLEFSEDPKVRQSAPRLKRALDRAISLSSQTVEYGSLGNRQVEFSTINLTEVCTEILEDEKALVKDIPYKWLFSCPKGLTVKTDEEYFRRVYRNLVRNARQILDEGVGDRIITRISALEDGVAVQVEDDGPGMSEQSRESLFEPFKGSSRKGGTGLGLALSYELCILMGADLRLVKSDSSGTIFEIYLPKNPMIALAKTASSS